MLFEETGLSEALVAAVRQIGFTETTPVQEQVIPRLLLAPNDMVALAQTGTGKTAAFGLPLLQQIDVTQNAIQALIISPTRELCMQIANDFEQFTAFIKGYKQVAVYGGASIQPQITSLKKGVHVVIATPGRLMDLMDRGVVKLENVRIVVLDEADEMLNMGFREDMEAILSHTPPSRNTWLFSATMPNEIRQIAGKFMANPLEVTVGRKNTAAATVEHYYTLVNHSQRYEALKRFIDFSPECYAIIFTRTKAEAQDITENLIKEGYDIDALHGDLSQQQRDKVMKRFRERSLQYLIATDVAARGIDVDGITHVINYNLPDDPEVYTHRSGRTGRAGKSGICISIISPKEKVRIKDIQRFIGRDMLTMQLPSGQEVCEKQFTHLVDKIKNTNDPHGAFEAMLPMVEQQLADISKEELIKRIAALEFERLLEYYRNAPDLNLKDYGKKDQRAEQGSSDKLEGGSNLFFNVGSRDGFTKASILGFLLDHSGLTRASIGKIQLRDAFSLIEVTEDDARILIETFDGGKLKGRPLRLRPDKGGNSGSGESDRPRMRNNRSFSDGGGGGRSGRGERQDRGFNRRGNR